MSRPQQVETKNSSLWDQMHHRYFNLGYKEAIGGFSFNKKYDTYTRQEQWIYERGRQFGIATQGNPPLKINREVTLKAILAFRDLFFEEKILL